MNIDPTIEQRNTKYLLTFTVHAAQRSEFTQSNYVCGLGQQTGFKQGIYSRDVPHLRGRDIRIILLDQVHRAQRALCINVSGMSTPIEQFSNLSLGSHTSDTAMPSVSEVKARALYLQDVLSSFDSECLPTECEPQIVRNICDNANKPQQNRPKDSDWTISGNLIGTLLQRGAYTEEGWDFLSKLKEVNDLAYAFQEKLERRFNRCLTKYDELTTESATAAEARLRIQIIGDELLSLSAILAQDRLVRSETDLMSLAREASILQVGLNVLLAVCQRHQMIIPMISEAPRRSTRRTASNSNVCGSLFTELIVDVPESDEPFLLDAFEHFSDQALRRCLESLSLVNGELHRRKAPPRYITRFEALQGRAKEADEVSTVPSTPVTATHLRDLDSGPQPGMKRAQPTSGASPRRGKRTAK